MNKSVFVAILGALGSLAAVAPASAQIEFAAFSPTASGAGGVANFTEDTTGHLTGTSSSTPALFMFDVTPLDAFGNLPSTFDFSATETGSAATGSLGGVSYTTATFNGSFDYYYSGPTVTHGSVTLASGELLLHGSFTDAAFSGRTGSSEGGLGDDSLDGTVTYTSTVPASVLPLASAGQSFSIGFIDISPLLAMQSGFLRHFTAIGDGTFSSNLTGGGGGGGTPEPATWALMLVGVGAVGVAARRRRTSLATA